MSTDGYRVQIRDPIHGTLWLSRDELALVDHPAYQRLRSIKQLGLADLAFPGATHTRYAHSLGVMHIASRMFNVLSRPFEIERQEQERLLETLRLAALFHDIGHAPLSHTTEAFMPEVAALELGEWQIGNGDRPANHEDYTVKIITDSDLTGLIRARFASTGVTPEAIATLIAGRSPVGMKESPFVIGRRDWMPLLRQCVSSELDADRMDYLLRDSYYAGVPYGRYDIEWLLENLVAVEQDNRVRLGLNARASFGFEDFLLSRYHMFMSVYFHHVPIGYEVMLRKLHDESPEGLIIPADIDGYLQCDDVFLISLLRKSRSPWARRIVERRAFRMLVEAKEIVDPLELPGRGTTHEPQHPQQSQQLQPIDPIDPMQQPDGADARPRLAGGPDLDPLGRGGELDLEDLRARLESLGISCIAHQVKGRLSKYFDHGGREARSMPPELSPLIVDGARTVPVEVYVPLYRRYSGAIHLRRIYVDPERFSEARDLLKALTP